MFLTKVQVGISLPTQFFVTNNPCSFIMKYLFLARICSVKTGGWSDLSQTL